MPRYNIALLPVDTSLQKLFTDMAKAYFENSADGYLLGQNALAHVTLSQFHATSDQEALDVYNAWSDKNVAAVDLTFGDFNLRRGTAEHTGKFWAEFPAVRTDTLLEMQKSCFLHLTSRGLNPLTSMDGYSPHATLARLNEGTRKFPTNELAGFSIAFRPALGTSTENGVFIRKLTPT